jgi:hypothetical protein
LTIRTTALSINNPGDIVGNYQGPDGRAFGFLYSNGTYTTIDPPGTLFDESASVFGLAKQFINASGEIIGRYFDTGEIEHSFLYKNGTYTTIDPLGVASGFAGRFTHQRKGTDRRGLRDQY